MATTKMMRFIKEKSIVKLASLLLGTWICFVLGCGLNGNQPELGTVTGKITLDGQPLVGVGVVFQPESGRPAFGTTDGEGKYELTYIRQTKGTKVGPNRVEIAPTEGGEAEEETSTEAEGDGEEGAASEAAPKSGKPVVPARYNSKSELKVDVKPGANTFDFDLKS